MRALIETGADIHYHRTSGYDALIGRDVLAKCTFTYNGPANSFTLAY